MDNHQLYHHGVKGMRWGVRRYQNPDGTLTPAGRKRQERLEQKKPHEDYAKAHSKKSVQQMSDKELRERNNRLQMERQYADLTKKTSNGKKAVNAFIATAGTLTAVVAAYGKYKDLAKKGQPYAEKALRKLPTEAKSKVAAAGMAYYIAKGSRGG